MSRRRFRGSKREPKKGREMTSSSKRRFCCTCFFVLHSLLSLVEGKAKQMEKPMTTEKTLEASTYSSSSSQTWMQFHGSPDTESSRPATRSADASPRQPDLPIREGKSLSDGEGKRVRKTRQVDPLHSCIEAKCPSLKSTHYLNCVYHHCINGFESSASSRLGRDIAGKMYGLMMREGSRVERLLPGEMRRTGRAARIVSGRMRQGGDVERNTPDAMNPSGQAERNVSGKMQQSSQAEDMVPRKTQLSDDAERMAPGKNHELLLQVSEAEPLTPPAVASVPGAFLSVALPRPAPVRRRGFNDISDVCKERNCGPYQQSVEYFNCIENIVDCPSLLRR